MGGDSSRALYNDSWMTMVATFDVICRGSLDIGKQLD